MAVLLAVGGLGLGVGGPPLDALFGREDDVAVGEGVVDTLGVERAVWQPPGQQHQAGLVYYMFFLLGAERYLEFGAQVVEPVGVVAEKDEALVVGGVGGGARPGAPGAGFVL